MTSAITNELFLRRQMVDTMLRLDRWGLNCGMSGNISVRCDDSHAAGVLMVTPSAITPETMTPADMVVLDFDGKIQSVANTRPTSEWRIHCDILRLRSDVGAVVHAHSPFATSLACLGKEIPAFHYMVAVAGGDSIRCAPYALFGTQELSEAVLRALDKRRACLLANHGLVAVGADLPSATALAREVEALCGQYWRALQIGEPALLSREQMREVIGRFADYRNQSS